LTRCLPIAKQERVGAINWGFVAGKTQTYFAVGVVGASLHSQASRPYGSTRFLHPDGTPYRQAEVDLIRQLTGKAVGTAISFGRARHGLSQFSV